MRLAFTALVLLAVACIGCSPRAPADAERASVREEFLLQPTGKGIYPIELAAFRGAVDQSKTTYLKIVARKESGTSPWVSKYRGSPYWPNDTPYPTDPEGRPLILLVQVNFADAPRLEGYPDRGILQLFISPKIDTGQIWGSIQYDEKPVDPKRWFASLQDQRFFRVAFHDNPLQDDSKLASVPRLARDDVVPIMQEARLIFELQTEYVLPYDYRFREVFGKPAHEFFDAFSPKADSVANRYIDFAHEWAGAKIGGYASFVQRDPRESAPDQDWQLLLEIQSDNPAGGVEVLWGDGGVGGLFIRQSDLAKRDFSKVAYYWDNH